MRQLKGWCEPAFLHFNSAMKSQISAKVVLATCGVPADRLTSTFSNSALLGDTVWTFSLRYPRIIHSEFMTHRVFSRNASSSRAIPIMKMLEQVWNDPAMPVEWGANQPGMQADNLLPKWKAAIVSTLWKWTGRAVCIPVWIMHKLGAHKQIGNRLLEPWQWISVVMTATELDNWFDLRDHKFADPTIQALAQAMRKAQYEAIDAGQVRYALEGDWHIPYILDTEQDLPLLTKLKISAARCARVSYLTHEGLVPKLEADLALFDRLVGAAPIHASPVEHQARYKPGHRVGNLKNWQQQRQFIESHQDIPDVKLV